MLTDAFDFDLPRGMIAQHPAVPRDSARLLAVGKEFGDRAISDLPRLLNPGDVLVLNDTGVIPARLAGTRGKARIEVTLHKLNPDGGWRAFARPARRLSTGDEITFADGLTARVAAKGDGGEVTLVFVSENLGAVLERIGHMPLPPYIDRKAGSDDADVGDYQTIYARHKGAVAAPTAGLHFTEGLLDGIRARGIKIAKVTLHVGAGTFLPVKVDNTADHVMHSETGIITSDAANIVNVARATGGRVVACGTTSLRLLESAADGDGKLHPFDGETDIFITPGYKFRMTDMLLTNFHLPRSTLFMLVAAFSGLDRMKAAYGHAIEAGYRFYSYGDACLLTREDLP